MKKIILSCAAALLAIGSAHATPKFLSLNNKHGKTTIKIEIPASDRDETNGLSIEDVVLYTVVKPSRQRVSMQFGAIIPPLFCSSRNLPLSRIAHSLFLSTVSRSVWIFRAAWPIANKIRPS